MRTGERFGTEHLANVLIGENSEAVEKFGHDRLPTFGVGKEYGKQEWRSIFRQLHGAGIIALDITGYGTWTVTEAGRRVLKGADKFTLRKDTLKPAPAKPRAPRPMPLRSPMACRAIRNCSRRCGGAVPSSPRQQRVAAYVVFADKTLIDMARRKPATTLRDGARCTASARRSSPNTASIFLDVIRQHARCGPRILADRKTGKGLYRVVPPCCTAFARMLANAAIFAGSRGIFRCLANIQVPLKSQGLDAQGLAPAPRRCAFAEQLTRTRASTRNVASEEHHRIRHGGPLRDRAVRSGARGERDRRA